MKLVRSSVHAQAVGGHANRELVRYAAAMSSYITPAEVAAHATHTDCWVIVHGEVYDVTKFLQHHPGGVAALSKQGRGGRDVSSQYVEFLGRVWDVGGGLSRACVRACGRTI